MRRGAAGERTIDTLQDTVHPELFWTSTATSDMSSYCRILELMGTGTAISYGCHQAETAICIARD